MLKKTLLTVIAVVVVMSFAVPATAQVEGSTDTSISQDTVVRAWGLNLNGQLGDGTYTDRHTPVVVKDLRGVQSIASGNGSAHSLALKNDGTVWAWGENYQGQLGDGTTTDRTTPVQVSGLSGVKAISVGYLHSLALKTDGTVWAWGGNRFGQLGDGTHTGRFTPVQVGNLSGVKAIEAGMNHSLALKNDGTAVAWGYNSYGQLGDGTTTNRFTPVTVSGLSEISAIAGGSQYSLALKTDGTVRAWGSNFTGQLGDGTATDRYTPVPVKAGPRPIHKWQPWENLSGVKAIAAGDYHGLALKSDGTVRAWGANFEGQLGDLSTTNRSTPVQVYYLSDVKAIAAGSLHSLALRSDGKVGVWGDNSYGQLGDGTTSDRHAPIILNSLGYSKTFAVKAIAAGGNHSLAKVSEPVFAQ